MAVTEKRPLDETVYSTKHIVMDIEGTTTSISFVKDTLFPYVRKNLDTYLNLHWDEEEFKGVLALLKDQASEDKKANMEGADEIPSESSIDDVKAAVVKNVLWQMDADRKTTALKKLQGHMWRQGYKSGELKGHLFADVAPALQEWVKDGRKLYIYSSGSVEAQKLLFGHTADGDLTELFTDFFDTEVGAKNDADSYKCIVKKLSCNPDDVLFLTDLPKEASAAREAGLPAILVEREGNEPIATELRKDFSAVSSFQELEFETSIKKQKVDPEVDAEPLPKNGDIKNNVNGQSADVMEVDQVKENVQAEVKETKEPEIKVDAMDVDVESEETETKVTSEASINSTVTDESNGKTEKSSDAESNGKTEKASDAESNGKTEKSSDAESNGKTENSSDAEKAQKSEESDLKPGSVEAHEEKGAENNQTATEAKNGSKDEQSDMTEKLDSSDNKQPSETEKESKSEIINEVNVKEPAADKSEESTLKSTDNASEDCIKEKTDKVSQKTEDDTVTSVQKTGTETDAEKLLPKDEEKTEADCETKPTLGKEGTKSIKVEEINEVKEDVQADVKGNDKEAEEIEIKGMVEVAKEVIKEEGIETVKAEVAETSVAKGPNNEVIVSGAEQKGSIEDGVKDDNIRTDDAKDETGSVDTVEKEKENKINDVTEPKEKLNGVTNGTNGNNEAEGTTDTNGTVENGHGKVEKAEIPEVIVTKNTPPVEKVGDADVVVEA